SPTASPTPTTSPTTPGTGCTVVYTPNAWTGGFTAEIRVTNRGGALNGWTVSFTAGAGVQLSNGWNGRWSQSGQQLTVSNESWNGSVPGGGTINVGFQGTYTGSSLPAPSGFTLNGTPCA
ncbi:cellulose binding domain-containing protein, partial [Micromonospora echinofusca]